MSKTPLILRVDAVAEALRVVKVISEVSMVLAHHGRHQKRQWAVVKKVVGTGWGDAGVIGERK